MRIFECAGLFLALIFFGSCSNSETKETGDDFLREHITWLTDEERNGRLAGTINEADAANYISDQFLQYGLIPAGDQGTYIQQFLLQGPMVQAMELEDRISRNVAGIIEGEEFPNRYVIIGAHYDGQGIGGAISMDMKNEQTLHYSADDNASGTAGLLYLAQKFSEIPSKSSLLFVAFSGEELGLLGSNYFADEMNISPDSVLAMINLDMIGRLDNNKLHIFGTGTSSVWDKILPVVDTDSLSISTSPGGMGSSDHASFYRKEIPVLHYYTGTHNEYHKETDTADKINYPGMRKILTHVVSVITSLDSMAPSEVDFQESTDQRSGTRMRDGVMLGVIPEYTYSDFGLKIDRVQPDGPADKAGIEAGDVIIEIDGDEISDIYDYMEQLNSIESGDTVSVKILREEQEVNLTVTF